MEPNQPNPVPAPDPAPVPPSSPDPVPEPVEPVPPPAGPGSTPEASSAAPAAGESDKEYLTAWLLAYFLGIFGADRFYLGQTGLGIAKLLTLGGCGIWALIDWIMIFAGATKDKQGRPLAGRAKNFKLTVIIFLVVFVLGTLSNISRLLSS